MIAKNLLVLTTLGLSATTAYGSSDTSTFFDSSWSAMGFVLGYGDRDAYVRYACSGSDPGVGQECDGPPEKGLVGKLTGIITSAMAAAELTSCADIPTSGSKSVTISGTATTMNFETPTQKIPASYDGGGTAFDRRITFTATLGGGSVPMVIEGSCAYDHTAFVAINMAVGDHAPGYKRPMNVWFGSKGEKEVADILLAESTAAGVVRGAYGFALEVDTATKQYKIWGAAGTHYDNNSPDQVVDTYNLTGNYQEHSLSMRAKRFVVAGPGNGNYYMDTAALEAISGSDVADLPATTNFDLLKSYLNANALSAGQTATAQGCLDFDSPSVNASSASACAGMDWSTAPTPVIDANGKYSALWVFKTLNSKLVGIPSL